MEVRSDIAAYAKLAVLKTGPVAGQVEVTSHCFQHCRMCESWRDDAKGVHRGTWSLDQLKHLCFELESYGTFEHLALTGGDPQHWPVLDAFLEWFQQQKAAGRLNFHLQLNTALTQEVKRPWLWCGVRDLRVSLDSPYTATYQRLRGDKHTTPSAVLSRLKTLDHPRVQIAMTVTPENVVEIPGMLTSLRQFCEAGGRIRKATFLPVLGDRASRPASFWAAYEQAATYKQLLPFETSFADSVLSVRHWTHTVPGMATRCWSGNITFHLKCDGSFYPCCLVGGEAIVTHPELAVGNVFEDGFDAVWRYYKPERHYADINKPCRDICQYKQAALNLAAEQAASSVLSMP